MNIDTFWQLIDRVHAQAGSDMDEKCELLAEALNGLNDADLRDFLAHFDAANARAYNWKLWAAAYVINGGCSDDGFSDFRASLISCGRAIYENALNDPDSLADFPFAEDLCYEGYQYVGMHVAEARFSSHPPRTTPFPSEPSGQTWEEDDLPNLLPRLSTSFG